MHQQQSRHAIGSRRLEAQESGPLRRVQICRLDTSASVKGFSAGTPPSAGAGTLTSVDLLASGTSAADSMASLVRASALSRSAATATSASPSSARMKMACCGCSTSPAMISYAVHHGVDHAALDLRLVERGYVSKVATPGTRPTPPRGCLCTHEVQRLHNDREKCPGQGDSNCLAPRAKHQLTDGAPHRLESASALPEAH